MSNYGSETFDPKEALITLSVFTAHKQDSPAASFQWKNHLKNILFSFISQLNVAFRLQIFLLIAENNGYIFIGYKY